MRPVPNDIRRIQALPRRVLGDGVALAEKWTRLLRRHPDAPPLRPIQGLALEEIYKAPSPCGILGAVGVGYGKTLISFLAGAVKEARRPMLCIPPDLKTQTMQNLHIWSKHYRFPKPRVLSYAVLSQPSSSDLLTRLAPDLLVFDEVHSIANFEAARTKRVARYMEDNRDTCVVALSGTMTQASVHDYAHIAQWALRDGTCLPMSFSLLEHFSAVLDSGGIPSVQSLDLVQAATRAPALYGPLEQQQEQCRVAYQRLFKETPGIIATSESAIPAKLVGRELHFTPADVVTDALNALESTWELPDGSQLVDALSYARACKQVAAGFYYVWDWPNGEPDNEWLDARKTWGRVIRATLRANARENFDSPALVTREAIAGTASAGILLAWKRWAAVKDRPEPPTKAVWLDKGLVFDVAERIAAAPEPCLVWYQTRAMGEMLGLMGLPVHGQGSEKPRIADTEYPALSTRVHNKGKDLQEWHRNLVVEPSSNGATWEQLLGRTHRVGQSADTVYVDAYVDPWPFRAAIQKAKREALYMQDTTGQVQRINLVNWSK